MEVLSVVPCVVVGLVSIVGWVTPPLEIPAQWGRSPLVVEHLVSVDVVIGPGVPAACRPV